MPVTAGAHGSQLPTTARKIGARKKPCMFRRNNELRTEPRVAADFPATLTLGDTSMPCTIRNVCGRGFLIEADRMLPVGDAVRLTCEFYPGRPVACTVQVRHVNAGRLGALVVEMDDAGRAMWRRYLEEQHAAQRAAPGS